MSARKPFLLLGTPNSGTDWLAGCIVRVTGWRYFQKEFFNPLTNAQHSETLLSNFGSELVTGLENLATCHTQGIDAVVERTWPADTFDFNKEVWSFCKLPALVAHFDCLVITRSAASLFPPSRLRVWQWYDAIYHAFARVHGPHWQHEHFTPQARALHAHAVASDRLTRDATAIGVPQLSYDHLINAESDEIHRVCCYIEKHWPIPALHLAAEILATRRQKKVASAPAQ